MKRMKGRLLTVLLSLAMAFTMMPIMGTPVYADDPAPAAIYLANGGAPNIEGGQKHSIYFGDYPQSEASNVDGLTKDVDYIEVGNKKYLVEPVKWRVLDNPVDVNGNLLNKLLLLSDQNLDCKQYHEQYTSITWKDSTIRAWLNAGFKNTAFLSGEQEALDVTRVENKVNPEYNTPGGENTQDQIFLLSIEEATNEKYGFTNNYNVTPTREAKNTAFATGRGAWTSDAGNGAWWLRSPGDTDDSAAVVDYDGYLGYTGIVVVGDSDGVRPALYLNLSSALFTSAAVGGKSSNAVGAGSLEAVGTNTTNEWKMTVKDEAHKDFKVDNVTTCDGKTLNIKYSGAVAKDGEYISAIITDQFRNIKYYGNLKQFADEDSTPDTAEVTIEGKMESTDTLYIINEQLNGDKKTDFSSPLQKVMIPTELHDWNTVWSTDGEKHWHECTVCHEKKDEAAHTWDAGKVTKAATEQAEGVNTFTCTVCKATKTEIIPKLKPSAPKVSGTALAKMTAGKTSLTISWNKIQGADGYDIFFAQCNHSGKKIVCKNVKTIKGNKTFKWTRSGLKKGTAYKSYVKAYVMKNGKKTYVKTSLMMHAYTGNGTKKYTNAKSVTVKKAKVSLKKGKTFKIKAKVNKVKKNKKLMPKSHVATLRYLTSDSKVVTVSKKGKITAKGKGSCVIYVFAHNGVSKQVKVTVK